MFCYQCGCPVDTGDRYCPQCGTQLKEVRQEPQAAFAGNKYFNIDAPLAQPKNIVKGYILTHVKALADHLNVKYNDIIDILGEFITARSKAGVGYGIIDMSRHISNPKNTQWPVFHRILTNYYLKDWNNGTTPEYLFIIGGCDIIPMPAIPMSLFTHEKDIDSDLPYEYLYEDKIEEAILSLRIFKKNAVLKCGRLPLASDTTFEDFIRMLSNILLTGQKGLLNMNLHVQCDPHWKEITTLVADGLQEYMPRRTEKNDFFHGPVMLTPLLEAGTEEFDANFPYRQASIFYYNLHGTNEPGVDAFVGYELGNLCRHTALYPQNMKVITQPNIVITEACFGGWFKRSGNQAESKKKSETILLSAMHAATVCYVGSSRVAYGGSDPCIRISSADALAQVFLRSMYRGNPAGVALRHAKMAVLNNDPFDLHNLITVVEFNLFGDPTLSAITYSGEYNHKSYESVFLNADAPVVSEYKVEYDSKLSNGILNTVRNLVNWNLQEINNLITNHLYSQYGVKPRQLNRVISSKSSDGTSQYTYFYAADNGEWMVGMDKQSKRILYTVCSK